MNTLTSLNDKIKPIIRDNQLIDIAFSYSGKQYTSIHSTRYTIYFVF
jgi:hypothetical protein